MQRKFDEAIALLDAEIKRAPQSKEAFLIRGMARTGKNMSDQASSPISISAGRLAPNDSKVYAIRADNLTRINQPDRALADYIRAIELDRHKRNNRVCEPRRDLTCSRKTSTRRAVICDQRRRDSILKQPGGYAVKGMLLAAQGEHDKALGRIRSRARHQSAN